MKKLYLVLFLGFAFLLFSSLQCEQCITSDFLIGGDRGWLPRSGLYTLSFIENGTNRTAFQARVIDTTITATNPDCDATYRAESAEYTLFLNPARTDSIAIILSNPGDLCISANSNDTAYINTCRFLNASPSEAMKPIRNYQAGKRTYSEVRLFFANLGTDKSTDSVAVAPIYGVVGFKYKGQNYALE